MRTMLIPTILLLFCTLTQPLNAVGTISIPSCVDAYKCFAPENCLHQDDGEKATENADGQYPDELGTSRFWNEVNENCPALFRFHSYTKQRAQVSIMSFEQNVKSIIIRLTKVDLSGRAKSSTEFSCIEKDGKFEGKYKNDRENFVVKDIIPADDPIKQATGKLQCTFMLEMKKKSEIIFNFADSRLMFEIQVNKEGRNTIMKSMMTNRIENVMKGYSCDLRNSFEFVNDVVNDKKFTKVLSKPGRYYCEDPSVSILEYKLKTSTKYEKVATLICDRFDDFYANGILIENKASFDIRCAADARFYCDHEIKSHPGEQPLEKTLAIREQKIPGELRCPNSHPYLFIDGKLVLNPEFECRNYGATEYWTVIQTLIHNGNLVNKTYRLTPKGPMAYCTKTIHCSQKYRILDSAVEKGTLDSQNLPLCYDHGVLYVGDDEVTSKRCDEKTGNFKYEIRRMKGVEQIVNDKTKFECKYPVRDDEEQNKKDNASLALAGGIGITICIALVVASVIGMVFLSRRHIREMNLKHEKEAYEKFQREELAYKHYALTKDEKRQMKNVQTPGNNEEEDDGDDEKEAPASAPCADPTLWNDLVMDFCCDAEKLVVPTGYWGKELIGTLSKSALSQDQELKKAAKDYKKKSEAKITEYAQPRQNERLTADFTEFMEKFQKAKAEGLKR